MKTFRKKSLWRCFDIYALIAIAYLNVQIWRVIYLGVTYGKILENSWDSIALIMFFAPTCLLYALWHFSHSASYVVIDKDMLIIKNAIFGTEKCYPIHDIERITAHHKRNGRLIRIYRKGQRRRIHFMNMAPPKEVRNIISLFKKRNIKAKEYYGIYDYLHGE